ncbi:hypothetical protein UREG_01599 [Uncinocarpus reesii 1704]|uniref:Core domain-containing protein n=1 Tax=Uncinocarpus reesii (strain UAMH 1704) TaxID=336963 RepID=C4JIZ2_UNCRE|nr:uncharacterized protein UREG_01599 [Uncinocarpus reesii 1704]EEP76750.1 hypothetical protein UREG_01599 [Uncinocarpus reesii 1704]
MSQRTLYSVGCRLTQCPSSPAASLSRQCARHISSTSSKQRFAWFRTRSGPHSASLTSSPQRISRASRGFRQTQAQSRFLLDRRLAFSTTAANQKTTVSLNPRADDDGNPMTVEISARAAKLTTDDQRLRELTDPSSKSSKAEPYDHLRVTVTSGGCHGFQYLMSLDPSSKIDREEDTVFEADSEDASQTNTPPAGEAKVVMDSASLELLKGSTIDYTVELIGSQFKIVNNPRASSSCGCGTSFDVTE